MARGTMKARRDAGDANPVTEDSSGNEGFSRCKRAEQESRERLDDLAFLGLVPTSRSIESARDELARLGLCRTRSWPTDVDLWM
jgi:hypothetical protein